MILSNKLKGIFKKMFKPIKGVATSRWHHEDLCNSKWTEDDIDFMGSPQYQEQGLDLGHKTLKTWRPFPQQQQLMPWGFRFPGYATQTPAAVIWYATSWNSGTTYPAGNGKLPVYNSFVQYQGIIYAIPGTSASTAGTPPPGGVWVVQQPTAPQWIGANPSQRQSGAFSIVTGDFPQPAPGSVDQPDATWDFPDTQFLAIGSTNNQYYYHAPGIGYLGPASTTAAATLQVNLAGTFTSVGPTLATSAVWLWYTTDGITCRWFSNNAAAVGTFTYYRVRQLIQ